MDSENLRINEKLKNQTRAQTATKARKNTKMQEPQQRSDSKVWWSCTCLGKMTIFSPGKKHRIGLPWIKCLQKEE